MWWAVALFVVAVVIAYAYKPKVEQQKPPSIADITAPTAEEGREVPVLFGEVVIEGPNVCWYGDYRTSAIIVKK